MSNEVKKAAEEYAGTRAGYQDTAFLQDAFLAGHAHAMRWVPVAERLPEIGDGVVLMCRDNGYRLGFHGEDGKWWAEYNEGYYQDISDVTHWLPLPPAPKEQL
jgi:hypothetical protein